MVAIGEKDKVWASENFSYNGIHSGNSYPKLIPKQRVSICIKSF